MNTVLTCVITTILLAIIGGRMHEMGCPPASIFFVGAIGVGVMYCAITSKMHQLGSVTFSDEDRSNL